MLLDGVAGYLADAAGASVRCFLSLADPLPARRVPHTLRLRLSQMFFLVETFRYHSQVAAKSSRGKNSKGKKVTSLTPFPLPSSTGERLLVTTNDSRLRLYHTADKIVETTYAGHENASSQIRASFSDDGRWIISGSEDRNVYSASRRDPVLDQCGADSFLAQSGTLASTRAPTAGITCASGARRARTSTSRVRLAPGPLDRAVPRAHLA